MSNIPERLRIRCNNGFQRYLARHDRSEQLQDIVPVVWYGGSILPPNEPPCGFEGSNAVCQRSGKTENSKHQLFYIAAVSARFLFNHSPLDRICKFMDFLDKT